MHPPLPISPAHDIGVHQTHEELMMLLEGISQGAPVPPDVITNMDLSQVAPRELFGDKTNWVMHEYKMDPKHPQQINDLQDSTSLCRVLYKNPAAGFGEQNGPGEYIHKDDDYMNRLLSLILENSEDNHTVPDPTNCSQVVMEDESLPVTDLKWVFNSEPRIVGTENLVQSTEPGCSSRVLHEGYDFSRGDFLELNDIIDPGDLHEGYVFSRGDFLELNDIIDPKLSTSGLGNSSDVSLTSPEDFDLLTMPQNVVDENNLDSSNKKSIDQKFSASTALKSNQTFIKPPPSGPLHNSTKESASPATMHESVLGLFPSHLGSGLELPLVQKASECINETSLVSKKIAQDGISFNGITKWGITANTEAQDEIQNTNRSSRSQY